jgi:hypothetical protein
MPFGVSWYWACWRVILSDAPACDIRNASAAGTALTTTRISARREPSNGCSDMDLSS